MPTGYTAKIAEGISFKEYAMSCARAFGALVTMRDEPMDAEIQEFKPSDYHVMAISEKQDLLERLDAMSDADAEEAALGSYRKQLNEWEKRMKDYADLRLKYEAMLAQVIKWEPPSPEHVGMKEFMRDQIHASIRGDCHESAVCDVVKADGVEWRDAQMQEAKRSIAYYAEAMKKEEESVSGRNEWVRQLRGSLG